MWTGNITIGENKQIPFQLFLDLNSAAPAGYFLNGSEQTSIPEIRFHGDSLSFIFSEYSAAMSGIWDGKEWRGKFFRYRTDTSWNEFVSTPKEIAKVNINIGTEQSDPDTAIFLEKTVKLTSR